MDLPPDAVKLRSIWNKGRPDLPLPNGIEGEVRDGLEVDRHWVARLNAARLASLVGWSPDEREVVVERLLALRDDPNRFVRPWALGALWRMVAPDDPRRATVEAWMSDALASGSASERARGPDPSRGGRQGRATGRARRSRMPNPLTPGPSPPEGRGGQLI